MSDKPKGYLVEWYDESAYSYFADEDGAMVKKFYLGQHTDDIKITPLYTRAQSPAEAKLEAIREALERCNEDKRSILGEHLFVCEVAKILEGK